MSIKIAKKIVIVLCLLFSGTLAFAQESISFGTTATYPPFISKNAQGQFVGLEMDLVNAICQKLQAKCTVTDTTFESLIPSVINNKFDAVFDGINITKQRQKIVNFTDSYLDSVGTFLINKNHKLTLTKAGLKGKTIGYEQGTNFRDYLSGVYGNSIKKKPYLRVDMGLIDLESGRIDALVMDKVVAKQLIKNSKDSSLTTQGNLVSTKYFGIGKGIAVKKGNTKLLNQLNTAISQLKQDGTLQKIISKWFN